MTTPDQDTILGAVEDARRILGEYKTFGPSDAGRTADRLMAILDRDEVIHAIERMKKRRTLRLVK